MNRRQALQTIAATLAAPALPVEPLADPRYAINLPPEDLQVTPADEPPAELVYVWFRGTMLGPCRPFASFTTS